MISAIRISAAGQRRCVLAAGSLLVLLLATLDRSAPSQTVAPLPVTPPHFVTYDAGFSRWLNAPKTVEMSQGVTFNQDDAYLKTDAAIVNLDSEQRALNAKSLAPVHLYDSQNDLIGKQGFIDFTRHVATITEAVTLRVKPGPQDAAAPAGSLRRRFKSPATMTCDKMTYDYRHKIGHVPGPLTIHQENRVLTANSGEYDANAHTITLEGDVHGRDTDGNIIQASHVVVGIEEGSESITVPVPTHGIFRVKDDEDADTGATPPPKHSPIPKTQLGTGNGAAPAQPPASTTGAAPENVVKP